VPRTYWKEAVYSTDKPVLYIVRTKLAGQAGNLAAHHPAAETVVVRDLGHAMFVDDPVWFDGVLQSFLTRRIKG
jgi:microsomal epoxide hydrolase